MAIEEVEKKDSEITFRVSIGEKTRFYNACDARGEVPAEVLRAFMQRYVHKPKR